MVRLTITPTLLDAINTAYDIGFRATTTDNIDVPLDRSNVGDPIEHSQVIAISRFLRSHDGLPPSVSPHLDNLLRGSRLYSEPSKTKAEPTSEYKALMSRLRREEEARTYERMVNPPPALETFQQRFPNSARPSVFATSQADIGEDEETTLADVNRQMALIINVLVSIVACSVAIWLAARHWSTPSRLGLSMGGSGMVGIAEVVVYAGYIRRVKDAREKSRNQLEVKKIIKTWVIGGEEPADQPPGPVITKDSSDQGIRRRIDRKR